MLLRGPGLPLAVGTNPPLDLLVENFRGNTVSVLPGDRGGLTLTAPALVSGPGNVEAATDTSIS